MYKPSEVGVWQDAIVFTFPSLDRATSTLHTLQEPKGSKLGASHRVGTRFFSLYLLIKESIVSPFSIWDSEFTYLFNLIKIGMFLSN